MIVKFNTNSQEYVLFQGIHFHIESLDDVVREIRSQKENIEDPDFAKKEDLKKYLSGSLYELLKHAEQSLFINDYSFPLKPGTFAATYEVQQCLEIIISSFFALKNFSERGFAREENELYFLRVMQNNRIEFKTK
ncbi:MAG: hypothetical protein AAF518_11850 [Spirochaetota bacterium]